MQNTYALNAKHRCFKINVKEKGKVYDNTAKMQFINQLGA